MDFFNDPSLFGGGLEGLDDDGFASAPSLVDELNLTADFEPLQVEPLGPGKHQDMMPPASTQQAMPSYSQSMGHYIDIKANVAQAFSGSQGISEGMIAEQHGSYHNAPMSQVPQSNGLFCNSGSPMWGNQDQNGNMYQALPQQQLCHQQQQLQSQQLHGRHQTQHHPCYQQEEQQHRMRQQQLQQQQSHQQQLLNQHQQINTQTVSLQQQHHNFPFHQGGQSSSQQQIHHTQQQVQRQLTVREQQFHSRALPSKHYLESQNASMTATCLQTQPQQGNYQLVRECQAFPGTGLEESNLSFPMHSSSMVHSLPICSVSSARAYQPTQYPTYPGEPELPSLNEQSLSSASVSRPSNTTAPLTSTIPELTGTPCQFSSTAHLSQQHTRTPISQAEECPFRAIRCSRETQGNCKSSELFGESMRPYPNITTHLPSEQPQSCRVINTNGYQALGDSLLPSAAHDEDLDGLEPPDLLPDLLPQLEHVFKQEDKSNCGWTDTTQEIGIEYRKPSPIEYSEDKVTHFILFVPKAFV